MVTMVPIFAVPVFKPIATFSISFQQDPKTIYSSVYDSGFPTATDVPTGYSPQFGDIYTSYNSQTGGTIATWVQSIDENSFPYYAVFNGTVWSESQPMFESVFQGYSGVFTTYNPITNVTVATFSDVSQKPYYSVYNNVSWSEPLPLFESNQIVYDMVYTAFNPISGNIVGVFQPDNTEVHYTFYDGVNWTPSLEIADGLSNNDNIFVSYSPDVEGFVATWANNSSFFNYAIYDGSNWNAYTLSDTTVSDNICTSYDYTLQQLIATYSGADNVPMYSIFENGFFTAPVAMFGESDEAYRNVNCSYDPNSQQTIAVWRNNLDSRLPMFSSLNAGDWSAPQSFSDQAVNQYVFSTVYQEVSGLNPPLNLSAIQFKNNFGLFFEIVTELNWVLSDSEGVSGYNVVANGVKIGSVGALETKYQAHNQTQGASIVYEVIPFDADGNEGAAATVVVN
jgi:hypothetical protein